MLRAGVVVLLLCTTLLTAPSQHRASAAPTEPSRATRAEAALARVEALFEPQDLADATPTGADRSATLALRDLALLAGDLPSGLQRRAASYLARPTANPDRCPDASCYRTKRVHRMCSAAVCVHYVLKTDDRFNGVRLRDTDGDGRPNYVERVLGSVTHVHETYVDAGYRKPMGDGRRGGDARPDIYLAQIGHWGLYGYCTTDLVTAPQHGGTWAYCVLDNNYREHEFPLHTPIQNMRVTAAHEYFHAVQFGYDIGEDAWFMEATATWVEDEVYDRVDDNVGYLGGGPMGRPELPLDWHRDGYWYGAWIFFRHVSERFPASEAGLPVIVRTMWRLVDARRPDAPDLYSVAAMEHALGEQGSDVAAEYLQMAAANLHPRRWYDEGGHYRAAPLDGWWTLTRLQPSRQIAFDLDHLSSSSYRFEPSPKWTATDWQLRITLDLAPKLRGSQALVRVIKKSGGVQTSVLELSRTGGFDGRWPFAPTGVKAIELTIANASTRYNCAVGTPWSCHGRPLDQDLDQTFVATAQRLRS